MPDDEFGLLELYCPDPECDCQMVLFTVASRKMERIVAHISLGFAPGDDLQPELDPYGPRPSHAEALLNMIGDHVNSDPAYVERLKTHYRQVKAVASNARHPAHARLVAWQKEIDEPEAPKRKKLARVNPLRTGALCRRQCKLYTQRSPGKQTNSAKHIWMKSALNWHGA